MTEFIWLVRVYYEDTDAGGVVYHASYLRFMERARTEWLRALGFEQTELRRDHAVLFAVRRANLEFLRPARFNDLLQVSASLLKTGHASLEMRQSVRLAGDGETLCQGQVKLACLDSASLRPRPLPSSLVQTLRNHV